MADAELALVEKAVMDVVLSREGKRRYSKGDPLTLDPSDLRDIVRLTMAKCAIPPSPSTAPEVDELPKSVDFALFEWGNAVMIGSTDEKVSTRKHLVAAIRHARESAVQAALASRPAEVDDEGLPPLLEPMLRDVKIPGMMTTNFFTAEQYRQGQRDAVAADRAKEWFVVGGRRVGRTYMAKLAHDAARYRWLRESSNVEAASILDMHSGDSMDARIDQAMALAAAQPAAK